MDAQVNGSPSPPVPVRFSRFIPWSFARGGLLCRSSFPAGCRTLESSRLKAVCLGWSWILSASWALTVGGGRLCLALPLVLAFGALLGQVLDGGRGGSLPEDPVRGLRGLRVVLVGVVVGHVDFAVRQAGVDGVVLVLVVRDRGEVLGIPPGFLTRLFLPPPEDLVDLVRQLLEAGCLFVLSPEAAAALCMASRAASATRSR